MSILTILTLILILFSIQLSIILFYLLLQTRRLRKKLSVYKKENEVLEAKIKERTLQLEKDFEEKAEDIHSSAIVGNIAKPLLHDIAAMISSLEIAFELLTDPKEDKDEVINRARLSLKELSNLVSHGKDFINKKKVESYFSPAELISTVLIVLKAKIYKGEIKIYKNEKNLDIKLYGIAILFERIIINLLLNAIEELTQTKRTDRKIIINTSTEDSFYLVSISDNGRGIKKEEIIKIFDNGFSLKGETNLGFGLSFVKAIIEKYFHGSIAVESQENLGTTFNLKFKINSN